MRSVGKCFLVDNQVGNALIMRSVFDDTHLHSNRHYNATNTFNSKQCRQFYINTKPSN